MAATQLFAPTTAATNSADIPIVAGSSASIGLKIAVDGPVPWDEVAKITRKDDGGKYHDTGFWLNASQPCVEITAEGTYRVEKPVTRNAIGAYLG